MEKNFKNIFIESLDSNNTTLNLHELKEMKENSLSAYTDFTNLIFIRDNTDDIKDKKIKLSELMKDDFSIKYCEALSNAVKGKKSDDKQINSYSEIIKSILNNGYLKKDITDAKASIPNPKLISKGFF